MTYQSVVLQRADEVARLTLNRPDKLNSLTRDMLAELAVALTAIPGRGCGSLARFSLRAVDWT